MVIFEGAGTKICCNIGWNRDVSESYCKAEGHVSISSDDEPEKKS